jgi:Type VI immunity for VRR-NUC
MMAALPQLLAKPIEQDGEVIAQVVLDLTVYLPHIDIAQLAYLVGWYKRICPPSSWVRYAIRETLGWDDVRQPNLTKQGDAAAIAGEPMPFLAPVRTRIQAGRPFDLLFWDGRETDTYTFSLRQIRSDKRELHSFVRVGVPPATDPLVLIEAARDLANHIAFLSGHAGYSFGYKPRKAFDAFTKIYPIARRYWGIDVEDLDGTLPRMKDAIKGVNWLTLIGTGFLETDPVKQALLVSQAHQLVTVENHANGIIFRVGDSPIVGDRHRPGPDLDALMALGAALGPLIVRDHPSFSGDGFIDHGNTDGWFHRFDDPAGWS